MALDSQAVPEICILRLTATPLRLTAEQFLFGFKIKSFSPDGKDQMTTLPVAQIRLFKMAACYSRSTGRHKLRFLFFIFSKCL